MSALRQQGDQFPDDLEPTEIPQALGGEEGNVVDAEQVIKGRTPGIAQGPEDDVATNRQGEPLQQAGGQTTPTRNLPQKDFFASDRREVPEDIQQTPPGAPAPSEMSEAGGALKKIGDALAKPGVQKTMAQWGAAIAGPDSFAARLAKPTVDQANAQQENRLMRAAMKGDEELQKAIEDSVAVSSETVDKVRKRRMQRRQQQQQNELAERRVETREDRVALEEERLAQSKQAQEFQQELKKAQNEREKKRLALEEIRTESQIENQESLMKQRAARQEIQRLNAQVNRRYKNAQIETMQSRGKGELSPAQYAEGLQTLSDQASDRLSDLRSQEQEFTKSLNQRFLSSAKEKKKAGEELTAAEQNAIEQARALNEIRRQKQDVRQDLKNYNRMIKRQGMENYESPQAARQAGAQDRQNVLINGREAQMNPQPQGTSPQDQQQGQGEQQQQSQGPPEMLRLPSFPSEQAARNAGYTTGDRVIINGQTGTLQ